MRYKFCGLSKADCIPLFKLGNGTDCFAWKEKPRKDKTKIQKVDCYLDKKADLLVFNTPELKNDKKDWKMGIITDLDSKDVTPTIIFDLKVNVRNFSDLHFRTLSKSLGGEYCQGISFLEVLFLQQLFR